MIFLLFHPVIFLLFSSFATFLPFSVCAADEKDEDDVHNYRPHDVNSAYRKKEVENRRNASLPILDELFPHETLDDAWESYPLFSTAYRSPLVHDRTTSDCESTTSTATTRTTSTEDKPGKVIPTILDESIQTTTCSASSVSCCEMSSSSESCDRNSIPIRRRLQALLDISDVDNILSSNPSMKHHVDYNIVKKMYDEETGRERRATLPQKELTLDIIHEAVSSKLEDGGGYSLVINKVQNRWGSIGTFARQLQLETPAGYVSCNLYLTPPPPLAKGEEEDETFVKQEMQSGFEPHWDWMDIIVVQLSGAKLWSVASHPTVYLSSPDEVHELTEDESDVYRTTRYDDFLLRPGDVLYIPRGFVHNASTMATAIDGSNETFNDVTSPEPLPSLHLTFGIEHACDTTMEMLLHRAVDMFFLEEPESNEDPPLRRRMCHNQPKDIIRWDALLHMSIVDTTRRVERCHATMSAGRSGADDRGACELKKSVLLSPAWMEVAQKRRGWGKETDDNDPIRNSYILALRALRNHASLDHVASRVEIIQKSVSHPFHLENFYCLPNILPSVDILLCPPYVIAGAPSERKFTYVLNRFIFYAERHFDSVVNVMKDRLERVQWGKLRRDDAELKKVGQSIHQLEEQKQQKVDGKGDAATTA